MRSFTRTEEEVQDAAKTVAAGLRRRVQQERAHDQRGAALRNARDLANAGPNGGVSGNDAIEVGSRNDTERTIGERTVVEMHADSDHALEQ